MHIHNFELQSIMRKSIFFILLPLLVSCDVKNDALDVRDSLNFSDFVERGQLADKSKRLPSDVYSDLISLIRDIRFMTDVEFESLGENRIYHLAKPLFELSEGSVELPDEAIGRIEKSMHRFLNLLKSESLNSDKRNEIKSQIDEILHTYLQDIKLRGQFTPEALTDIFKEWRSESGYELTCSTFFNSNEAGLFLVPGDNLQAAHTLCENTELFLLTEGSYYRQSVESLRNGTHWVGLGHARLDGLNAVNAAFSSEMNQSYFGWLEIANYKGYGIVSTEDEGVSDVTIHRVWFNQIGREADGQKYGAVKFEWATNIRVTSSKFKNVTSSIRFLNSTGPLLVTENEAINTGRNFFQCDKCVGAGIRIEKNSMEHYGQSGTKKLEDFINIYQSSGEPDNYIQVRDNRARTDGTGKGVSKTGSFIILGDHGGSYQIAEGNIGVNPGNVGIGAAGGHHIYKVNNIMYSDPVEGISNVAFYSYLEPLNSGATCQNHISEGNKAFWYCMSEACGVDDSAVLNKAYAPQAESLVDYCGLTNNEINAQKSVMLDSTLTRDIWENF